MGRPHSARWEQPHVRAPGTGPAGRCPGLPASRWEPVEGSPAPRWGGGCCGRGRALATSLTPVLVTGSGGNPAFPGPWWDGLSVGEAGPLGRGGPSAPGPQPALGGSLGRRDGPKAWGPGLPKPPGEEVGAPRQPLSALPSPCSAPSTPAPARPASSRGDGGPPCCPLACRAWCGTGWGLLPAALPPHLPEEEQGPERLRGLPEVPQRGEELERDSRGPAAWPRPRWGRFPDGCWPHAGASTASADRTGDFVSISPMRMGDRTPTRAQTGSRRSSLDSPHPRNKESTEAPDTCSCKSCLFACPAHRAHLPGHGQGAAPAPPAPGITPKCSPHPVPRLDGGVRGGGRMMRLAPPTPARNPMSRQ